MFKDLELVSKQRKFLQKWLRNNEVLVDVIPVQQYCPRSRRPCKLDKSVNALLMKTNDKTKQTHTTGMKQRAYTSSLQYYKESQSTEKTHTHKCART